MRRGAAIWATALATACGDAETPGADAATGTTSTSSSGAGGSPVEGYAVVPGWPALEPGLETGQVSGLALDGEALLVFCRADQPWFGEKVTEPIAAATLLDLDAATGAVDGKQGGGRYFIPHGLFVDGAGRRWVTDVGRHVVEQLDEAGRVLRTLGTPGEAGDDETHFDQPTDVFVADDGTLYVADGYGNARVVAFDADGVFLRAWGAPGAGPGEFDTPHSIVGDAAGRLYVADRGNARVQIFEPTGDWVGEWKSEALGRPWAVALGPDGTFFVLDGGDQPESGPDRAKVVRVDADGTVLEAFGRAGDGPGEFDWPHDLAVSPDGDVFVGEVHFGARVQKFAPGG